MRKRVNRFESSFSQHKIDSSHSPSHTRLARRANLVCDGEWLESILCCENDDSNLLTRFRILVHSAAIWAQQQLGMHSRTEDAFLRLLAGRASEGQGTVKRS